LDSLIGKLRGEKSEGNLYRSRIERGDRGALYDTHQKGKRGILSGRQTHNLGFAEGRRKEA